MDVTTGAWGLYAVIFAVAVAILCVPAMWWAGHVSDDAQDGAADTQSQWLQRPRDDRPS